MQLILDKFNTEIFGIKMVNLTDLDTIVTNKDVEDIIALAVEKKYENICVKIDTGEKYLTNLFLYNGFELVDTQVMYSIPVHLYNFYKGKVSGYFIKKYQNDSVEQIKKIARMAFKFDRFHSDPFLPTEKSDMYYERWAENLCKGLADEIYATATVGLAAIKPDYQGKGLFTYMISEVISSLKTKTGIEYLHYGTQLSNIPILRTMAKFGGVILYSNHVLHKMVFNALK